MKRENCNAVGRTGIKKSHIRLLFAALLCAFLALCFAFTPSLGAEAITDTTAVVNVGELTLSDYTTRTDGKVFSGNNLSALYEYLTGTKNATYDTVKSKVTGTQAYGKSTIAKMLTSANIRTNVAAVTGSSKDIVVSFGGYDWTVTSLTADTNGDPIVTLWLANSSEMSKWQNYTVTTSTTYGTYPPNMYGTSYMRVVTLNAGGSYATSNAAVTAYAQSSASKWAKFTMSDVMGSLTSFIDTPSQVKYQEVESWPLQVHDSSGYRSVTGTDYYVKNDSYGTPTTHTKTTSRANGGWYSSASTSNYATYATAGAYYDDWADDYLWLPSITETGRGAGVVNSTTYYTIEGIWNTSANQRANSSTSWLRSGNNSTAYYVYHLTSAGLTFVTVPSTAYCVRPALHLNLKSAALSAAAAKPTATGISTSTNPIKYDASTHTMTVSGFYAEYMDYTPSANATAVVNGTTITVTATNASNNAYSITVTLKQGYTWADGGADGQPYEMYISKADPTVVYTVADACTQDALPTITLDTGQSTAGAISWKQGATFTNAEWEFTPTDTTNYNTKTGVATLSASGHNYSVNWTWATDYTSVTAAYSCTKCGDSGTQTVTPTAVTKVQATCLQEGSKEYTATLTLGGATFTDTKTEVIPKTEHNYNHVITAPTCTTGGYTTHTCTNCGWSYVDGQTAALGHDYSVTWTWATDNLSADAYYLCDRCKENGTVTVQADVQTQPATCTADGLNTYTVKLVLNGVEISTDTKTEVIPVSGHNYTVTWQWATDFSSATANYNCPDCDDSGSQPVTAVVSTKAATCTAEGLTTYTVSLELDGVVVGTDTKTKSIPKIDHVYTDNVVAPTCTDGGYTEHSCVNCGYSYKDTLTAALGHSYVIDGWIWAADNSTATASYHCANNCGIRDIQTVTPATSTQPATCTADGQITYTAELILDNKSVGTDTKTETLPMTGHSYQIDSWTWDADYLHARADYSCPDCGDRGSLTVEAKVTVRNATCSAEGLTTYTVTLVLGGVTVGTDTKTEIIPKTAHSYRDTVTAPTCTDGGYTTHVCINCGDTYTDSQTAALGHSYGAPTYSWNGTQCTAERVCSVCGDKETETVTATVVTTAPTCTEGGYDTYTATFTNTAFAVQTMQANATQAAGHSYGAPAYSWNGTQCTAERICSECGDKESETVTATVVTTAPTCTEGGYDTYTATFVNMAFAKQTKQANQTAAAGHKYNNTAVPPTCETGGYTEHICSVCGDKYTDGEIDALGHTYVKGAWQWTGNVFASVTFTCEVCDDVQTASAKSTYRDTVAATADSEGERVYTVTVTFGGEEYTDSKTVATPKLSEAAEEGSVTVTKPDGSPLDPSYNLVYEAVATTVVRNIPLVAGYTGVNAYDVELTSGGVIVQPDGRVQVTARITSAYRNTAGLKVYCVASDGTVTDMQAVKVGDDMRFTAEKLGRFVIACASSAIIEPTTPDGGGNDSDGGLPEGFPLWQIIVGGLSLVLAVVFVIGASSYAKKAKKFNKKRQNLTYAPAMAFMDGGMLFGIADNIWTAVALTLLGLCVISFVIMLVFRGKFIKAEAEYEDTRARLEAEKAREERARRDDEMKMLFMSMSGQRGKVIDDDGNFTEIRMGDVEAIVTRVVSALLPTLQSNQLPAGNNDELNAVREQQAKIIERQERIIEELNKNAARAKGRGSHEGNSTSAVTSDTEELKRKIAEHDEKIRKLAERDDGGFNDPYNPDDYK